MSVVSNWLEALQTTNVADNTELDPVSKWLVLTRASVFPMTIISASIGGLLAVPGGQAHFGYWLVCTVGLVLAHAVNNMVNDYYDEAAGVDTPDYARAQYAPHPILSGLVTRRGLLQAIILVNALDVAIGAYLTWVRGIPVVAFALAGFAISYFYVAPPLKLKHRGLGEPSVGVVWGPLMIAGSYYVTAGTLPGWVWLASLPYGLLVTVVLFGKHIDKAPSDSEKGIHTMPVLLGADRARDASRGMIYGFYGLVLGLVATGVFGLWTLLVLLSIPRARQVLDVFAKPRPLSPPENFPVWPLWYVAAGFVLARNAGGFFALGLIANAVYPVFLW